MWGIVTKKIGRVVVKEQGKSEHLLFSSSKNIPYDKTKKIRAYGAGNPRALVQHCGGHAQ